MRTQSLRCQTQVYYLARRSASHLLCLPHDGFSAPFLHRGDETLHIWQMKDQNPISIPVIASYVSVRAALVAHSTFGRMGVEGVQ